MKRIVLVAFLGLVLPLFAGCGKPGADGNMIYSSAFDTSMASGLVGYGLQPAANLSEFKVCVRSIRLENDDDEVVSDSQGNTDINFRPGLIDLSDGQVRQWGAATLPVGFALKRIRIKLHDDENLCQSDYSVRFNGVQTDEEVEFRWIFPNPVAVDAETDIELPLQAMVDELLGALAAGPVNSEDLKQLLEDVEEAADERLED